MAEVIALATFGAVISVPFALLCIVFSQKAAMLALDEAVRREMDDARKTQDERYQQSLTRFLEDCIKEEGDTPVWKSEDKQ